jgi:hypothetical protein
MIEGFEFTYYSKLISGEVWKIIDKMAIGSYNGR